jgi:hypothetical protein
LRIWAISGYKKDKKQQNEKYIASYAIIFFCYSGGSGGYN